MGEANAFIGEAIQVWGFDFRVSIAAELWPQIIGNDPDDVRELLLGVSQGWNQESEGREKELHAI